MPPSPVTRRRFVSALGAAATGAGLSPIVAAQARPQVTVTHLTAPAGIGEYEWGLTHDRLMARHSSWLRKRAQPTQGYIFNLRTALEPNAKLDQLVFNLDPISPWLAAKRVAPFDAGMGTLEPRALMNVAWPIWMFITKDPKINTPADLAGKRIALGPKAGTASVMGEELLKAAGVFDKVTIQNLSFADIVKGMLDDTIQVGYANLWYNPSANKIGPTQGIISLQSSGKPFRYVHFDKAHFERTRQERGVPIQVVDIPAGTIPLQTRAMTAMANADYMAVDRSFPEDAAYEIVKVALDHMDEINKTGGMAATLTRDFMPYRITNLHPGAARAYREAKLLG
jgi:TRAP transporter TAXI family solute receptor